MPLAEFLISLATATVTLAVLDHTDGVAGCLRVLLVLLVRTDRPY